MELDKHNMYRFPWSMNDNPIGWLEVTDVCNLHCKGCYRQRLEGHKPLEVIKEEIMFLKKWRNCDNISIGGGEPILHPNIVEIVRFIAERGMKPHIVSNGLGITKEMLEQLRKAKLAGICLHIDYWQNRPGWEGKNEDELCVLREHIGDIVYEVGGIPCSFNITVYKENFSYIPTLVRWAVKNSRKVQGIHFIIYRAAILAPDREYLIAGKKIELDEAALGFATSRDSPEDIEIRTQDVYQLIKRHFPEYEPS
ncbi:MAG: radical SAM protein, partial [Candidatus Aenigmarchaeota archaeon]|nr:radical SAM protein [Candidatus Aenigmarchaeota archaeon]